MLRFLILIILFSSACTLPKKVEPDPLLQAITKDGLYPEEVNQVAETAAGNWFYGRGVGDTAVKVGTVIAFPPFALALLGNVALNAAGYESIGPDNFLPEKGAEAWNSAYDSVTSVPGRVFAKAAGKEYVDSEKSKENIYAVFNKENPIDFSDV